MNGETLSVEQIESISRLPTRDVLYGRLVGMVASPLTGLATSLNALVGGLARQLQQMAEQGLVGGDAPRRGRREAPAADAAGRGSADDAPAAEAERRRGPRLRPTRPLPRLRPRPRPRRPPRPRTAATDQTETPEED